MRHTTPAAEPTPDVVPTHDVVPLSVLALDLDAPSVGGGLPTSPPMASRS
jgi:hypothetical protein